MHLVPEIFFFYQDQHFCDQMSLTNYPGVLDTVLHDLPPVLVHRLEELPFLGHLLHDVL